MGNYIPAGKYFDVDVTEADVNIAEAFIEIVCNDKFRPVSQTVEVDGTGEIVLFTYPPEELRLLTVTSVTLTDQDNDNTFTPAASEYKVHERYIRLLPKATTLSTWTKGFRNVSIAGTWGWATTPDPIIYLAKRLAVRFAHTKPEDKAGYFKMLKIGDYTESTSETVEPSEKRIGDPELDRLVVEYTNQLPSLLAV